MAAYRKRMAKLPVKLPLGPQIELCSLFEELQLDVVAPPKQTQLRNSWISAPTWAQIDKRAALQQQGKLLQQTSCLIGRQIKSGLLGNRWQRAATAAENIKMHLAGGETKEVWQCLKGIPRGQDYRLYRGGGRAHARPHGAWAQGKIS